MIDAILATNDYSKITTFLLANSNLPGRMANLTLANQVADYYMNNDYNFAYLSAMTLNHKDANVPEVFVVMCKLITLGSIFERLSSDEKIVVLNVLSESANGSWRIKEAVAMAFQRIGMCNEALLIDTFNAYLKTGTFSQKRAVVATLADYQLLESQVLCDYSLVVSNCLLAEISTLGPSLYKHEDFKVLEKGLAYAISVFVAVDPKQGFELLSKYAQSDNKVIKKIIKSNLGKKRLVSKYPEETESVMKLLG
ncbi:hypothetical protein [Erysipelothrix anatis]|uniref:hypothetical protein n=1 Tax=Erysipelothrix anatis TaxID=2683713 RepID=UPI00135778C0|nr:hypothetical protein [Erysipelothrix anatis]